MNRQNRRDILRGFVNIMNEIEVDKRVRNRRDRIPSGGSSKEPVMADYEINYLHTDGSLAAKFAARCSDDKEAKILAHAMKLAGVCQIEVWNGKALIYARPQKPS
jgi:hypothetical protein